MVKVILFESAESGLHFIERKLQQEGLCVFPSQQTVDIFKLFVPSAQKFEQRCMTPTHLLNKICRQWRLKYQSLPETYWPFFAQDTTAIKEDFVCYVDNILSDYTFDRRTTVETWLQKENYTTFNLLCKQELSACIPFEDKVYLYGHFEERLHGPFFKLLQKMGIPFTWISYLGNAFAHSFHPVEWVKDPQLHLPHQKTVYVFDSIHEELEWYRHKTFSEGEVILDNDQKLLHVHSEPTYETELWAAWIQWIHMGTVEVFFEYITLLRNYSFIDANLYKSIHRDLQKAVRKCLTHDGKVLQTYLEQHKSQWLPLFKCPTLPEEGTFNHFLKAILSALENYKQVTSIQVSIATTTFPIEMKRDQFLDILLRLRTSTAAPLNFCTCMHTAFCFPYQHIWIPFATQTTWDGLQEELKDMVARWERQGSTVTVSYANAIDNSTSLPLWPATAVTTNPCHTELNRPPKSLTRRQLQLAPEQLQLSCKSWERLKQAPWQTWIENILSVYPLTQFQSTCNRQKILGEWTHACLQFYEAPGNFREWLEQINNKLRDQVTSLHAYYQAGGQELPYFIQQWEDWLYSMCHAIAEPCKEYFDGSWILYAEWSLPSLPNLISGCFDLLAWQGETLSTAKRAIVIDYKTSSGYRFTPGNINQGKGLQLILYGQQLQSLGIQDLTLVAVSPSQRQSHAMATITPKIKSVLDWLHQVRSTGKIVIKYAENYEQLPLCFCKEDKI